MQVSFKGSDGTRATFKINHENSSLEYWVDDQIELECLTHTLLVDTKGTRALGLSYLVADVELVRGNIPLARYESHRAEE